MWKQLSDGLDDEFQRGTTPIREPPIKRHKRDSVEKIEEEEGEGEEREEEHFRWYHRQREALEEMNRIGGKTRVFSEEDKRIGNGARRYLVTTVHRFWREYCNWKEKHHYELITENERCRLFFDLEFSRETNKEVNELRCLDHFIDSCINLLSEMWEISITRNKFLILDSSSPSKFSLHIIVHLPFLFPSAVSIRPFAERLRCRLLIDPPHRLLNGDGTAEIVIFDLAVYTRNRNFRLFLSSKADKEIPLVTSPICTFYTNGCESSEERIFLDSLCVPVDWRDMEVIDMEKKNEVEKENQRYGMKLREGTCCPSPFPYLDQFIVNVLSKWKSNDSIKKWSLEGDESDPSSITYYPSMGRYCFNIGRNHKSNGTYWRVDLRKGTMVQRCFDVDCKGISSNPFPVPSIVMNTVRRMVGPQGDSLDESTVQGQEIQLSTLYDQWDTVFET